MLRLRMFLPCALLWCVACATPNEVKQATTALDQQYEDNAALIAKYRDTLQAMNELEQSWSRYVRTRTYLSMALTCATQQIENPKTLQGYQTRLEGPLLAWVNAHRLSGLPTQDKLSEGHEKVSQLVQGLPQLAALIRSKIAAEQAAKVAQRDLSAYDDYAQRVAVLKSANDAVKSYLDVDVTVSKDDVQAITEAIRKLGASK